MSGTVLGVLQNGNVLVQPNASKPNRNIMVFGGPGSYKTQSVVLTNIFNETENSLVITDPKGELYESSSEIKRMQGYEVHMINFSDLLNSSRYNPLAYLESEQDAYKIASIFFGGKANQNKDFFDNAAENLFATFILYVQNHVDKKYRNIEGILNLIRGFSPENTLEEEKVELFSEYFGKLDFDDPSRMAYELTYKDIEGKKTGENIISTLTFKIAKFIGRSVRDFTRTNDFMFSDLGSADKKIALYVVIPALSNPFQSITSLFFTQMFEQLFTFAGKNHAKLPRQVNFILDEFVNLGVFPDYEEFLATCRGYGIGTLTILQSYTQLIDKYGEKKANSIIGNCAIKMCLSASNIETAQLFENLSGVTTVRVETESSSQQKNSKDTSSQSTSEGENYTQRKLIYADEIMRLPDDTSLVCFQGKNAIKLKKSFQFKLFPQVQDIKVSILDYKKTRGIVDKAIIEEKEELSDFEKKKQIGIELRNLLTGTVTATQESAEETLFQEFLEIEMYKQALEEKTKEVVTEESKEKPKEETVSILDQEEDMDGFF